MMARQKWVVDYEKDVVNQLRTALNKGIITEEDIEIIRNWVSDVEEKGLEYAQNKEDWRDHELTGKWAGYRAISFSYSGRVIYKVEDSRLVVKVIRITPDHDYK